MGQTIAALSSGLVPSGVAVLRVSGPAVRFALERIAGQVPVPRYATVRPLRDPETGKRLDEALVLFFPKPASFTGEDVAEFHCHGGRAVVDGVMAALLNLPGVVAAEPGGFTRQAFVNGKFDLTQVEAVSDLIDASTGLQRTQALGQLSGGASRRLGQWKDELLDVRAAIEADLDFSDEDDVPGSVLDSVPQRLRVLLHAVREELSDPVSERIRSGFRVVLAGAPNAGKSTLLNALLGREAALVSPIAGTTRDQIDVAIDMDGLPVTLSDTAGLRDTDAADAIERMGMDRTRTAVKTADCVVWLLDGGENVELANEGHGGNKEATGVASLDSEQGQIVVRSKSDLIDERSHRTEVQSGRPDFIAVSGVTGEGLSTLKAAIADRLRSRFAAGGVAMDRTDAIVVNPRRRAVLTRTSAHLQAALARLEAGVCGGGVQIEEGAEDLRLAQRALGEMVGDVDPEGLLDALFDRFCIGK